MKVSQHLSVTVGERRALQKTLVYIGGALALRHLINAAFAACLAPSSSFSGSAISHALILHVHLPHKY
jgi:hypothetical protein